MSSRNFISENNWFSLDLPENWAEYDDAEGTAAFFNTDSWSGNLRITPIRLADVELDRKPAPPPLEIDKPDSILIKLGDWNATFYSRLSSDGYIIYYWEMGSTNFWFICSFTIDKSFFNTDRNNEELMIVEGILSSIRILD